MSGRGLQGRLTSINAPNSAMRAPTGIGCLQRRTMTQISATRPAAICDRANAIKAPFHPSAAPSIAVSLISPPPMPPRLTTASSRTIAPPASAPPEWRPGDQWVYTWTSGQTGGTKSIEVLEIREINKVSFYLVKVGGLEQFYTRDLRWAGSMRDGKVQSRMTPPQPWFSWPLKMGSQWSHRGSYEDATGTSPYNDSFSVVGAEVVDVPAGRFNALKVVRETDTRDSDQYWYAPEVRFYVKWVGRRGNAQFEEALREYRPAQRLIPAPAASRPPSTTK